MKYASPLLMNAHALPVDIGEPHAQVGNHLRVNSHPELGLPVAPFVVQRAVVTNRKSLNTRHTASIVDRNKNPVTLPYEVTPERPLTILIQADSPTDMCIWAEVEGASGDDIKKPEGTEANPVPPTPTRPRIDIGRPPGGIRFRIPNTRIPRIRIPPITRPPIELPPIRIPTPEKLLTVEGFVNAAQGLATIGSRTRVPLAVSAPGLVELKVTGWGRVSGVRWIAASDPQHIQYQSVAIMNLPHEGGPRYLPLQGAKALAAQRLDEQAPKRKPLQETTGAPAPTAAPTANTVFERHRVRSLTTSLEQDLDVLITDTSELPRKFMVSDVVLDENGIERGSAQMRRIERVYQMQADPGTASAIGYKWRDGAFPEPEDKVVFYRVMGFFHDFPTSLIKKLLEVTEEELFDAELSRVPLDERTMDAKELIGRFSDATRSLNKVKIAPNAEATMLHHNEYVVLGSVAIADRAAPQNPVNPLTIVPPPPPQDPGNPTRSNWLPEIPPAARREVQTTLSGGRVGGVIAAGRQQPPASAVSYVALNRKNDNGFHLPLMMGIRVDDETAQPVSGPGEGFVADRAAGPGDLRTFVAQTDRFGRWSTWTSAVSPPGIRPKPPRPHIQGYYAQPAIADAVFQGGTITAHVPIPDNASLAPGSHPLQSVRIRAEFLREDGSVESLITSDTIAVTNKVPIAGHPGDFRVEHSFAGPVLSPTARRRAQLTAVFIDTDNLESSPSQPHRLAMNDPRPPTQPVITDTLLYSARPDVTGLAWIEYRWATPAKPPSYAVYYCDENRFNAHLEASGGRALLRSIADAPSAAARATLYRANQRLFPDHLYERLDRAVVSFNSGETGFRHAVSGSLRILNAYKIAAEAEAGGKPDLLDLDIVLFGVPNSDPPPRPTLKIRPAASAPGPASYAAQVDISLVAGVTEGQTWRLRRTRGESSTVTRLPIVTTGAMEPKDADTGIQTAQYTDSGPVQIATTTTLQPWVRYSWVAEIQGAAESGSEATGRAVPGRWSQASDPVSLILVPDSAPQAPALERFSGSVASGGLEDVTIALTHPGPLDGATMGRFHLRVARRVPDGTMTLLAETELEPDLALVAEAGDPGEIVPFGTEFQITLIDPVGRTSPTLLLTLTP